MVTQAMVDFTGFSSKVECRSTVKMESTILVTTVKTEEDEVPDVIITDSFEREIKCDPEHGIGELSVRPKEDVDVDADPVEIVNTSSVPVITIDDEGSNIIETRLNPSQDKEPQTAESTSLEEVPSSIVIHQRIQRRRSLLPNKIASEKLKLLRLSTHILRKEHKRRKNSEAVKQRLKLEILKLKRHGLIVQNKLNAQILRIKLEINQIKLNILRES